MISLAEDFATSRARTLHQRRLLQTALHGLREQTSGQDAHPPFVHLPLLVYSGLRGNDERAISLAAATSLLFLGLDIFDDLADGDLPPHWNGTPTQEINLAAATLLCALPQLAIAGLDAPAARLAAMQRTLAEGLLRMSAGQERDLAMAGRDDVAPEEVEESVVAKSGEELAIFASLAAQFAGAPEEVADTYALMGRALGTAGQLASDCYDLFTAPHSRDLAHGTRTLPVAMHLRRQVGEDRTSFLRQLEQARKDALAQEVVRQRLRAAGDLRRCAFLVEVYCQRALRALKQADPLEPAATDLRAMIDSVSFFPKGVAGSVENQ